jgi:predicted ArsR family transcriptional regulator
LLSPKTEDLTGSFGEPKKKLLYYLKVMQQVGLAELAKIRDEEGYMAESKQLRKCDTHIILEYNCPILQIAEKHWEACSAETELFEKHLSANVETTHRAANGDQVCRFMINDKKEEYL